mmetsp:Transcript_113327/g.360289  ORF Transcript_113327/g.360289 Transcript_113327/m.360289 type:complete len:234 (-) Transcript_113327:460-1161(-)
MVASVSLHLHRIGPIRLVQAPSTTSLAIGRQVANLHEAAVGSTRLLVELRIVLLLLLKLALGVAALLLALSDSQRLRVHTQQHQRVRFPIPDLQSPQSPGPSDPPPAARRVRDRGARAMDRHRGVQEMFFFPLGNHTLVVASVHACSPIERRLATQLRVRVHLFIQDGLVHLAEYSSIRGVGLFLGGRVRSSTLDNLWSAEAKGPVLLDIFLAHKVFRDEETKKLAAILRCDY